MVSESFVTPQWLEQHGFGRFGDYDFETDACSSDVPELDLLKSFDPPILYREIQYHRQLFFVILYPNEYSNGQTFYRHEVYVQYNVGMGYALIPDQHTELDTIRLKALYFAITGRHLQKTNK